MQIHQLNHVNLRTTRLEIMISWYQDVLGLTLGPRPDFPFPGAWLYAGDTAFVHLVGIDGDQGTGSEVELKLEHFAFSATGAEEFENRLRERGEKYQKSELPQINLVAVNVWDPDGNHIHVDFRMDG